MASTVQSARDLTGQVMRIDRWSFAWGGSADIYKGGYLGRTVAVKIMKGFPDSEGFNRRLRREVTVWSSVDHPNILPLLGICSDFDRPNMPGLVSPYYSNGNITNYLKCQPGVDRLQLLIHITSALSYLHSMGIIHGDMKASNILINDHGEACLSDHGLSRILESSGFTTSKQSATWRYAAPELFYAEEVIPRVTMPTDVWAYALTTSEILTDIIPFPQIKNDTGVILFVVSGGRPKRERYPQIDDIIWSMLVRCWDAEPIRRPSMSTLYQFFSQY